MENGSLHHFLENTPSDQIHHRDLAWGIINGLCYMHDHRVTHGDLKGYNILIDAHQTAYIADFGLAQVAGVPKSFTWPTIPSDEKSPDRWLAPELLTTGTRSEEGDIYAYGCVCYEIYAKCVPFHDLEDNAIYHTVVDKDERPLRPTGVTDEMWGLITRCWSTEPQSRPTAREIRDELDGMKQREKQRRKQRWAEEQDDV
ncbi:Receptor-interacting serine/threonine-protein kinase 1 [Marasmius tenuissimus]|nr:Receptor-interacting serine/threonine-protein kinase 1 [Marasmius tenuissimus]